MAARGDRSPKLTLSHPCNESPRGQGPAGAGERGGNGTTLLRSAGAFRDASGTGAAPSGLFRASSAAAIQRITKEVAASRDAAPHPAPDPQGLLVRRVHGRPHSSVRHEALAA